MTQARARGKLWMEAWRFSLHLAPTRLDRLVLGDAAKGCEELELTPAYVDLRRVALACADTDIPLTDEMLDALRREVECVAQAAKRASIQHATVQAAVTRQKPFPAQPKVMQVSNPAPADDAMRPYYQEGQYA